SRLSVAAWSSLTAFVSHRRRPISVDLPSSTLPQVIRRSGRRSCAWGRNSASGRTETVAALAGAVISEISFAFFLLHRARLVAVDGASLAFGDGGDFKFGNHFIERRRLAADGAGKREAAERAEAERSALDGFTGEEFEARVLCQDHHAVALD